MRYQLASILMCLLSGAGHLPAATSSPEPQQKKQERNQKQSAEKAVPTTMAGCIDQAADGQFVLIHDQTREKIANLVAEGFPMEGFAKYVGQKVTVRGTVSKDDTGSTFRVRKVEVISEICAPQSQP